MFIEAKTNSQKAQIQARFLRHGLDAVRVKGGVEVRCVSAESARIVQSKPCDKLAELAMIACLREVADTKNGGF